MFELFFDDLNSCTKIAEFVNDVEAIQLALALHQTSNISHRVLIEKDKNVFLSLEKTV